MELKEASSMQCLVVLGSWQMISYQAPSVCQCPQQWQPMPWSATPT